MVPIPSDSWSLLPKAIAKPIIANGDWYVSGDEFGDQYDRYVEAAPGDEIVLEIWTNDQHGTSPANLASGCVIINTWDSNVFDSLSVFEDRANNYYTSYWGYTGYNNLPTTSTDEYWRKDMDFFSRWVAEGKLIVRMHYTVRLDAPLGLTDIGLEAAFLYYSNWFDYDAIPRGDSESMKVMIVPEPATMSLLGLGGLVALLRRSRSA